MPSITVYCASSTTVPRPYFDAAASLGQAIARRGWTLVYGGNNVGPMGALADAARSAGGDVIGITPRILVDKGIADPHCHELIVTDSIRDRKRLLEERADAFITLPGGLGTLEEIFEILVARTLGLHNKPIILLNISHYYDPLLAMLRHGLDQHFIRPSSLDLLFVSDNIEAALDHIAQHPAPPPPPTAQTPPAAIE